MSLVQRAKALFGQIGWVCVHDADCWVKRKSYLVIVFATESCETCSQCNGALVHCRVYQCLAKKFKIKNKTLIFNLSAGKPNLFIFFIVQKKKCLQVSGTFPTPSVKATWVELRFRTNNYLSPGSVCLHLGA